MKQNIDLRELAFLEKLVISKTPCSVMMHVQNTIFYRAGRSRRSIFSIVKQTANWSELPVSNFISSCNARRCSVTGLAKEKADIFLLLPALASGEVSSEEFFSFLSLDNLPGSN